VGSRSIPRAGTSFPASARTENLCSLRGSLLLRPKKKQTNFKAKERQVERLAEAESNVRTRLVEMRGDVDALMHVLDRLTCQQQPRLRAGGSTA
jgi:hypothetical protein